MNSKILVLFFSVFAFFSKASLAATVPAVCSNGGLYSNGFCNTPSGWKPSWQIGMVCPSGSGNLSGGTCTVLSSLDVTTVTAGITDTQAALFAILVTLLGVSAVLLGMAYVSRYLSKKSGQRG